MKKIIIYLLFFGGFVFWNAHIDALEQDTKIEEVYFENVYMVQQNYPDYYRSKPMAMFYANGRLAYCIAPYDLVNHDIYNSYPSIEAANLDLATAHHIELIGYYGYEYPGHNTRNYYLAAQELIWETLADMEVYYTTEQYGYGELIDVETEKEEIQNLVHAHSVTPSFSGNLIEVNYGETYSFLDYHLVLDQYEVFYNPKNEVIIENNHLNIKALSLEEFQVVLKRKPYDLTSTLVYQYPGSQMLATLRDSFSQEIVITIRPYAGKVIIQKLGEIWDPNTSLSTVPLPSVIFSLYKVKTFDDILNEDNFVTELKTDEYGFVESPLLSLGNYCLVETETLEAYQLDQERDCFSLTKEKGEQLFTYTLNKINLLKKGTIALTKLDSKTEKVLEGAVFSLYDEMGQIVQHCTTDSLGKCYFSDLPYGIYTVKEVQAPNHYQLDFETYTIILDALHEQINMTIENDPDIEMPDTSAMDTSDFMQKIILLFIMTVSMICRKFMI